MFMEYAEEMARLDQPESGAIGATHLNLFYPRPHPLQKIIIVSTLHLVDTSPYTLTMFFSLFTGSDRDSLTVHSRPRQKKPHGVSNGSLVCASKLTKSLPASPSTSDFCQTRSCASEHRYWSVGDLCMFLSHCWGCIVEGKLAFLWC